MKYGLKAIGGPLAVLLALAVFWEASVRMLDIPAYILPGPLGILQDAWKHRMLLLTHGRATLLEIALGFGLAWAAGTTLAVLMHVSRLLERTLMPLVVASQTIPVFAIAPLLVLWFGYGIWSKVVMTAVIVFFPIVVNTVEGLRSADPDLIAMMTIMEASPSQVFFKVRVPQALPNVFAGIKIGVSVSTIGAVIGEWVGAREGLGFLMVHANAQLQTRLVFAAIGCLSLAGIILYGLACLLERHVIFWRFRRQDAI